LARLVRSRFIKNAPRFARAVIPSSSKKYLKKWAKELEKQLMYSKTRSYLANSISKHHVDLELFFSAISDFNVWEMDLVGFLQRAEIHAKDLFHTKSTTIFVFDEANELIQLDVDDPATATSTATATTPATAATTTTTTTTAQTTKQYSDSVAVESGGKSTSLISMCVKKGETLTSSNGSICVPILLQETVIGVIQLTFPPGPPIPKQTIKSIENFATCVATPICRYLDVKHARDNFESLFEQQSHFQMQVSEPSERALTKTRILERKCAKWLQMAKSTTKLTHPIRLARSFRSSIIKNSPRLASPRLASIRFARRSSSP